jgi:hypothetical protein
LGRKRKGENRKERRRKRGREVRRGRGREREGKFYKGREIYRY